MQQPTEVHCRFSGVKSQDTVLDSSLLSLGNVHDTLGAAAAKPGLPLLTIPAAAPATARDSGGDSRRQSLSDLTERPSGLANVMSAGCLSTSPSLEVRDESASSKDGAAPAGAHDERSHSKGEAQRGRSPHDDGGVDGIGCGGNTRGVSVASSRGRPPSPPLGTGSRQSACASHSLKVRARLGFVRPANCVLCRAATWVLAVDCGRRGSTLMFALPGNRAPQI